MSKSFLQRTLNYVFLRHPDAEAAKKMGQAAASTIGNPTQFDLNFRTDRVAELKGKPLAGQKIHTYCAGLLLVCAQETSLPRETFFPIVETTAGGHTKDNLAKLGLSLGNGFVSPTGALFSPQLKIVGRNEPLYEPRREVEEAIYDYFAQSLEKKDLRPVARSVSVASPKDGRSIQGERDPGSGAFGHGRSQPGRRFGVGRQGTGGGRNAG